MTDRDKQPGVIFDGIVLVNENFYRVPSIPSKLKIDIEFNMVLIKLEANLYSNELTTNLGLAE